MIDAVTGAQFSQDLVLFILQLLWDNAQDGLANHFARRIAKHLVSPFVPADDDAI
jgi:hypothetical protein